MSANDYMNFYQEKLIADSCQKLHTLVH